MKFLVDMNLSPRWVGFLGQNGFEARHWSTVGRQDAVDSEIMRWAAANGYILLTNDLDFSAILAATEGRAPSVVQVRTEDVNPDISGGKIIEAIQRVSAELEAGAVLSVSDRSARLRPLPVSNKK